jgi:hypothetical protein
MMTESGESAAASGGQTPGKRRTTRWGKAGRAKDAARASGVSTVMETFGERRSKQLESCADGSPGGWTTAMETRATDWPRRAKRKAIKGIQIPRQYGINH